MKRYCLDTSGLSTPLQQMPPDVHPTLWARVQAQLAGGHIAVTTEIHEELCKLDAGIGAHIKKCKAALVLEVQDASWDWQAYLNHSVRMQEQYKDYISEFTGGRKKTIGINDLSGIALAKTLGVPLISSEGFIQEELNSKVRRIPNICKAESIEHISFTDFLRRENISI